MEYVEAEGQSIDDAIARALQILGVSRDKVDIEIVANATRGLFGFGGRRAKVRATMRRPLALDGAPAPAATAGAAAQREPAPPEVPGARVETRPDSMPRAPRTPTTPRPAPRVERPRRERIPPARPRATTPRDADAEEHAATPVDPATLARARGVLEELLRLMGSSAVIEPDEAAGVHLAVRGDASGVLIGRRGQTLDAIEYLVNRIVHDEGSHLVVDIEGYRQRRRLTLEEMARRVAERALQRGKAVTLSPMSPRDRRIVHLALQDDPRVTTRSAGTGFYRKIVITPEGTRRR